MAFKYQMYFLNEANDWEPLYRVLIGSTNKTTLDESLDMSALVVEGIKRREPFEPFTKFKREIMDFDSGQLLDTIYRDCAEDSVMMTSFGGEKLYTHTLTLIEPTKELERYVCDNLTFTNSKLNNIPQHIVEPTIKNHGIENRQFISILDDDEYLSPINENSITIRSIKINYILASGDVGEFEISKNTISKYCYVAVAINNSAPKRMLPGDKVEIPAFSKIDIIYHIETNVPLISINADDIYSIYNYSFDSKMLDYSISKVCTRLLSITPTRLIDEKPVFQMADSFIAQYQNEPAPEYTFTQKTLFDALLEIGKSIQSIPYIKIDPNNDKDWNTIDFIKLGGSEKYSLEEIPYSAYQNQWSCEQYCDSIDGLMDNVLITDLNQQGTMYEPFYNAYITARTESGILNEDNTEMLTSLGIAKLKKVTIDGATIGRDGEEYDITSYVYEKSNYNALRNYITGYGSQSLALYYNYGEKNIKGLYVKAQSPITPELEKPAIQNILSNIIKENTGIIPYDKIYYNIEYVPFVNTRLKQYKPVKKLAHNSSLVYNQQSNIPDSRALGNNMLGTVARIGNDEPIITYILEDYNLIPKVGQLTKDGYYVSIVECEYWHNAIKCTVTLSKDFNRLSEYTGIKSYERFYEISERMALNRYVNIEDFAIISTKEYTGNNSFVTDKGLFGLTLSPFVYVGGIPISIGKVVNKTSNQEIIANVALSAASFASGSSLVFSMGYQDNFAATSQLVTETLSTGERKFGKPFQYTDIIGSVSICDIELGGYAAHVSGLYDYPDASNLDITNPIISIKGLALEKDNREAISLTYQMHYRADNSDMVIGENLTANSALIGETEGRKNAKYVFLSNRIGRFNNKLYGEEISNISWATHIKINNSKKSAEISSIAAPIDCEAWAIVDGDNNLLIGYNQPLKQGSATSKIYINYTRDNKSIV